MKKSGNRLSRCPDFVIHYNTFEQLHHNKQDVFERGIINVFKGLSWDYKTNNPCYFGKKIIVNNLVKHDRWGYSLNWGWRRD
ncbi:Uncharacterised protein [Enterobacter hormaechei]|nr:Uncharacterised protein [Enterobacter hormaechei]